MTAVKIRKDLHNHKNLVSWAADVTGKDPKSISSMEATSLMCSKFLESFDFYTIRDSLMPLVSRANLPTGGTSRR